MSVDPLVDECPVVNVGFTGTLRGMSHQQKVLLERFLFMLHNVGEWHDGDAVGADREARRIARSIGCFTRLRKHPATKGRELQRDKEIVAEVDILIAAPRTDKERLRSGTWATVRYARAKGIPVVMLPRGRDRGRPITVKDLVRLGNLEND